jgi:hypothetical protein
MSSENQKKQIRISPDLISTFKELKEQMNFKTYEEVIWYLLSNRELWIGHIRDNEKKWFLSWSDDLEKVEDLIEKREGSIEEDSWQKIMEKGYFMFDAEMDEAERIHLNEDRLKINNNEIDEWIRELIKYPIKSENRDN